MARQQRKIVFFLGAGASLGAGATAAVQRGGRIPIPTQANFWPTFLRFCSKKNRKVIESFLFRYFLSYRKVPARQKGMKRWTLLTKIDVEEVFTFLSERALAPGTTPQFRVVVRNVWEALTNEIAPVFSRFTPNASTRTIFQTLVGSYVRAHDTIVSFNYDTVFEDSLWADYRWHYDCVDEHPKPRSLRILKPHGSANWSVGSQITVVDNPKHALVVAPTHLKFLPTTSENSQTDRLSFAGYLDQSSTMPKIWSAMEREMRAAKALVFIGYSFPLSDLYFSSVLRYVLASRDRAPEIVIVNPDAIALGAGLKARFSVEPRVRHFDLGTFVQTNRAQLLASIRQRAK